MKAGKALTEQQMWTLWNCQGLTGHDTDLAMALQHQQQQQQLQQPPDPADKHARLVTPEESDSVSAEAEPHLPRGCQHTKAGPGPWDATAVEMTPAEAKLPPSKDRWDAGADGCKPASPIQAVPPEGLGQIQTAQALLAGHRAILILVDVVKELCGNINYQSTRTSELQEWMRPNDASYAEQHRFQMEQTQAILQKAQKLSEDSQARVAQLESLKIVQRL